MTAYILIFTGSVLLWAVITGRAQGLWKAVFPEAVSGAATTPTPTPVPQPNNPQLVLGYA